MGRILSAMIVASIVLCAGGAAAQTAVPAICIYESKSYSEGAYLCVRPSLMLGCAPDNGRAVWKVIADAELSGLCRAGAAPAYAPRRASRRHHWRHTASPTMPRSRASARCFTFNGRNYCE